MLFNDVKDEFSKALSLLSRNSQAVMQSAYELAEKEHQGQVRKLHKGRQDEDPYLIHPLRVALILMNELQLQDITVLASAVLHDVVEDGVSRPSIDDISKRFGVEIGLSVNYLTKPDLSESPAKELAMDRYHASFESAPLHVRLVKLSDRLDNLRECCLVDRPKFQNRYLNETRQIYLPLAEQTSLYFSRQYIELCARLEKLLLN
ncbi:MAG: HD domain-containing protein [Candidatus Obscuribacterales bacterium]|nr:HD domain-containing protein [Candidatus Obscuribacterales bacterium]